MEEFFSVQLEATISNSSMSSRSECHGLMCMNSGSCALDADVCISTQSSGVPSMSAQTMTLVRQNSRHIAADLNESFSSSTSHWPSIDEDNSMDLDQLPVVKVPEKKVEVESEKKEKKLDRLPEEVENEERLDRLKVELSQLLYH